jgi:hypothetical protein
VVNLQWEGNLHGEVAVAPGRATGARATPPASASIQCPGIFSRRELLGHASVATTLTNIRVMQKPGLGVRRPLDARPGFSRLRAP